MKQVISVKVVGKRFHQRQPCIRSVSHGDCNRPVQLDNRRWRHQLQHAIQRRDLRPVGVLRSGRLCVKRGNRRLHLIGTRSPHDHCRIQLRKPFVDHLLIPASAILILQQHQIAPLVNPSMTSGMLQQHQREQSQSLRLARHQAVHHTCQPDGLVAQLDIQTRPR